MYSLLDARQVHPDQRLPVMRVAVETERLELLGELERRRDHDRIIRRDQKLKMWGILLHLGIGRKRLSHGTHEDDDHVEVLEDANEALAQGALRPDLIREVMGPVRVGMIHKVPGARGRAANHVLDHVVDEVRERGRCVQGVVSRQRVVDAVQMASDLAKLPDSLDDLVGYRASRGGMDGTGHAHGAGTVDGLVAVGADGDHGLVEDLGGPSRTVKGGFGGETIDFLERVHDAWCRTGRVQDGLGGE